MAAEVASPFTIREVTGDKRKIQLVGRALPHRPFELDVQQVVNATKLPGFADKTVTVLGAEDMPFKVGGRWCDIFLDTVGEFAAESGQPVNSTNFAPFTLNGQAITNVKDATDIVDSFCRFGQELEVTWLHEVRRVILQKFHKGWANRHDVEWDMEFEAIGRGESAGSPVFITGTSLADSANALRRASLAFSDVAVPSAFGMKPDLLAQIGALGRSIDDAIFSAETAVENVMNAISLPVRAAKALDGICRNVENECKATRDYIFGRVAMDFHDEQAGPLQSFTQRMETALWQRNFYSATKELERIAAEQRTQNNQNNENNIMGTYTAKQGDDLRDVSQLFYNTPWEWRRIMKFNQLSTSELQPGQVVLVPKLNPENPNEA